MGASKISRVPSGLQNLGSRDLLPKDMKKKRRTPESNFAHLHRRECPERSIRKKRVRAREWKAEKPGGRRGPHAAREGMLVFRSSSEKCEKYGANRVQIRLIPFAESAQRGSSTGTIPRHVWEGRKTAGAACGPRAALCPPQIYVITHDLCVRAS